MDFDSFLGKMSSQGATNLKLPNSEEIMQRHLAEEAQPAPDPTPVSAPRATVPEPAPQSDVITEETIERVYEATSAILKTIRQAFPNKLERRMAFESIQNAISMALNDGSAPVMRAPVPARQIPVSANRAFPSGSTQNTSPTAQIRPPRGQMVEDGEYIIPRQQMLEGMPVEMDDPNYSRAIDIRPGQGLVGVSETDIADLKALAGI